MRVIKNINNNISFCLDSNYNEVVAFGKGIGFKKPPYEILLSQIERTFYDVNEDQLALLNRIPEKILNPENFGQNRGLRQPENRQPIRRKRVFSAS